MGLVKSILLFLCNFMYLTYLTTLDAHRMNGHQDCGRGVTSVLETIFPAMRQGPLRRYHASVSGRRRAATSCLVSWVSRADL